MSAEQVKTFTSEAVRIATIGMAVGAGLMLLYLAFEPVISRAITDEFTVTQTITGEISFATPASDVTMSPAIASITGGTSTGATQVIVTTNETNGYTMDISFATGTDATAVMQGQNTSGKIQNYTQVTATDPDFDFAIAPGDAEFAYSVHASNSNDVDGTFLDNTSACGTGGTNATWNQCWMGPSTTPERIIDSAPNVPDSGSTSTIQFMLVVAPNPSPGVPADTYNATATLTAVVK